MSKYFYSFYKLVALIRAVLFFSQCDFLQQALLLRCSPRSLCLKLLCGHFRHFSALDGDFLGVLRASLFCSRVFLATGFSFSSFRFRPEARRRPGHYVVARAEIADFIAASLNEPLVPLPVGCSKRPEATAAFKYSLIA